MIVHLAAVSNKKISKIYAWIFPQIKFEMNEQICALTPSLNFNNTVCIVQ